MPHPSAVTLMNPPPLLHVPTDPALSGNPPNQGKVRAIGWVLIFAGPGLSLAMASAAQTMYGTMVSDRLTGRPTHWHGSPGLARMGAGLFGAVFLLGIVIFLGGIYQVRTGRRNPVLVVLALGLFAVAACLTFFVASGPS